MHDNPELRESLDADVQLVADDKKIKILKDVGLRHGVTVTVLNTEGEYTTPEGYTGMLREGKRYVRLSSPQSDLSSFWNEVDAK